MAYTRVNWENYPSTNTPRNATNLNIMDEGLFNQDARITTNERNIATNTTNISNNSKYLSVTPNTNGDYKGNYGITLTANQIYHIYFNGNATDATKNARVSLDNGINYYNVYYNTINVKAGELSNNYVTLYFDGVKFVSLTKVITGNVSISTYSTSDQTTSGTNLLTLSNTTSILRTGGKKLLIIAYSQAYNSGDGYAYNMNVIIGNNAINMCINNGTTKNTIVGTKILDNIPAGEYSTNLSIIGTNASSRLIVPSFSPYGYSIIEI